MSEMDRIKYEIDRCPDCKKAHEIGQGRSNRTTTRYICNNHYDDISKSSYEDGE